MDDTAQGAQPGARPHVTYDVGEAASKFGRRAFKITHDLSGDPLFALDALAELAERLPQDAIEHNGGNTDVLASDADALGQTTTRTAAEVIRGIAERPGFVALPTSVPGLPHQPGYQELFEQLLAELAPMTGAATLRDHHAVVFVSSGGNTTPVHYDPEPSFLLHLRGVKRFSIGRHPDPAAERLALESFYRHEGRNPAVVPVDVETFALSPGEALHVPPVTPHWVENGPEVAISFSVGFQTSADHLRRGVYQWNARARKLGLTPKPYGHGELRDRVKGSVMVGAFEARRRLKRRPT